MTCKRCGGWVSATNYCSCDSIDFTLCEYCQKEWGDYLETKTKEFMQSKQIIKPAWNNVKKKLPETKKTVLAYSLGAARMYMCWLHDDAEYNERWVICEEQECYCFQPKEPIDFWMEMPKPPQDLGDLNHDFFTVPLTDHTYCKKCGEEDHVVKLQKIRCPGNKIIDE